MAKFLGTDSIPVVTTLPGSGVDGQIVYNTTNDVYYGWNGATSTWQALSQQAGALTAPAARAYNSTTITHNNTGQWVAMTLDSERFDNNGIHDTASNTSRFTCQTAGLYTITGDLQFAASAGGSQRYVGIRLNGSTYIAISPCAPISASISPDGAVSTVWQLVVGDYVELVGFQDSGGNLAMGGNGGYQGELSMVMQSAAPSGQGGIPTALAASNATVSVATSTWVALPLASETFDTNAIHDTVTNNSRFTCQTAGLYYFYGQFVWGGNTAGTNRRIGLRLNGSGGTGPSSFETDMQPVTNNQMISVSGSFQLAVSDYIELIIWHDIGSTQSIGGDGRCLMFCSCLTSTSPYVPSIVSTLPTNPTDGQECRYLGDSTNRHIWHLKYDVTDGYWHPIGATALYAEITADESPGSSAAYVALTTAGPSITVPLQGDYEVEIGCRAYGTTTGIELNMSYDIGVSGAVDADSIDYYVGTTTALPASPSPSMVRIRRKTGLAASTALVSKYKQSGTTAHFSNRWMKVTPLRVK